MTNLYSNWTKYLIINKKKQLLILLINLFSILLVINIILLNKINNDLNRLCPGENARIDFEKFDNQIGTKSGCYIVPNIIHFIRFAGDPVTFLEMICYLAAFKNHKPEKIYFHYDYFTTFSGKYWEILKSTKGFMDIVTFYYMEMPTEIFGQKFCEEWRVFHASDIARIRVLMKYGGIFLDNDMFVIRNLDDHRRYEMALGWDHELNVLGTQCLIAHKDARFLNLWLETYRGAYDKDKWFYNAGERPVHEVLNKRPELVHRVNYLIVVHTVVYQIYSTIWEQWKTFYAIHLLTRHLYTLGERQKNYPEVFDENNVLNYKNTLRELVLSVYSFENKAIEMTSILEGLISNETHFT